MVKSLFDKNDIVFLIEHWLVMPRNHFLNLYIMIVIFNLRVILQILSVEEADPLVDVHGLQKKTFQYLVIMFIINIYLRLKLILMLNLV